MVEQVRITGRLFKNLLCILTKSLDACSGEGGLDCCCECVCLNLSHVSGTKTYLLVNAPRHTCWSRLHPRNFDERKEGLLASHFNKLISTTHFADKSTVANGMATRFSLGRDTS
eukprot:symbB.v1.2.028884.t1/scaffold3105.1/size63465/4